MSGHFRGQTLVLSDGVEHGSILESAFATVSLRKIKALSMKSLQFNQLNETQKTDAIKKMAALSKELNFTVFGSQNEGVITEAIAQDATPDADFMFVAINESQVDVTYRENI